jgi:hypothetical protein
VRLTVLVPVVAVLAATTGASASASSNPAPNPVLPRFVVRQVGPARSGGYAAVEVRSENLGGPGVYTVDFGDGSTGLEVEQHDGCGGLRPGERDTQMVRHAYRYPGTWTVTARFVPRCEDVPLVPIEGTGAVTVTAGTARSNGPFVPLSMPFALDCHAAATPAGQPRPPSRTMACFPDYHDEDGYLTRAVVRWGDGSRDTVLAFPLSRCTDPANHWPATDVDPDGPLWGVRHRYPRTGSFRAFVTVTTAGCDGRDRQTRTASTRLTV